MSKDAKETAHIHDTHCNLNFFSYENQVFVEMAPSVIYFNFLLTFNLNTSIGWPFVLHTFFSHNKCCRNLSKPITSMSAGHSYVTVVTL